MKRNWRAYAPLSCRALFGIFISLVVVFSLPGLGKLDGDLELQDAGVPRNLASVGLHASSYYGADDPDLRLASLGVVHCNADREINGLQMSHSKPNAFVVRSSSCGNKNPLSGLCLGVLHSINNINQCLLYECA
jgi:hypothetical protein